MLNSFCDVQVVERHDHVLLRSPMYETLCLADVIKDSPRMTVGVTQTKSAQIIL